MDTYQTMAQSVLNYLSDHQYCSSLIKANKRCFEKLRDYLEEKIMRLPHILPYLDGQTGILHLEDWTEDNTDIVFERPKE